MELAYLHELYLFFHNHQYDDKYPTFRESDIIIDYDMEGIKNEYVVFYS